MSSELRPATIVLLTALALAACTPSREPVPLTPPEEAKGAAVVRRPVPEVAPPAATVAPPTAVAPVPAPLAGPPIVVPAGSIYVCVSDANGVRQQTAIQFAPKVGELCAKHPEMGPCQYERELCRKSGGRVYAAGGVEITQQTEAEYDKKVMRVRFKAN